MSKKRKLNDRGEHAQDESLQKTVHDLNRDLRQARREIIRLRSSHRVPNHTVVVFRNILQEWVDDECDDGCIVRRKASALLQATDGEIADAIATWVGRPSDETLSDMICSIIHDDGIKYFDDNGNDERYAIFRREAESSSDSGEDTDTY